MVAKTFEIRDHHTFIPMLAVKLTPSCEKDRYLLARAGFGRSKYEQEGYVLLCQINGGGGKCQSDIYEWGAHGRTFQEAQKFIEENFDSLESGAVIDVQYILLETNEPKKSEQEEHSAYGV